MDDLSLHGLRSRKVNMNCPKQAFNCTGKTINRELPLAAKRCVWVGGGGLVCRT